MHFLFNRVYYYAKWTLSSLPHLPCTIKNVRINRPVFLVGNQGSGLTLVSRILRRVNNVVSVSGNSEYWSGPDEMQRVMVWRLPKELSLSGRFIQNEPPHPRLSSPRSWSYASDDLVEHYHLTEKNYAKASAEKFRSLISEVVCRHRADHQEPRFLDKSQVFTLKIRYISALLDGKNPHFALITRNPYAACYRAATGKAGDMERYTQFMDLEERVEVCSQHWTNSISYALRDGQEVEHFTWFRFEDILRRPEEKIKDLCRFLDLEFENDLLPAPHDKLPIGSKYRDRWYPLRPEVNQKYLKQAPSHLLDIIESRCKPVAREFGYERP